MPLERLLHDSALNPHAAPVDQAHLSKTGGVGCVHVLLDHRNNVPRMKGVEVQLCPDRYPDRIRLARGAAHTWR
jgi:hypothetical protein